MTRLAIYASILFACGNGDSVPGPECGDGVIDTSEECDDGNGARGDGCFECVVEPPVCGNGVLDFNEDCDDSNVLDGDGCSAICEQEIPPRKVTATWTFKDLTGNVTTPCPAGFPTVIIDAVPGVGETISTALDCALGTGDTDLLPPGTYDVSMRVVDAAMTTVYATSATQSADVSLGDGTFATTIFNDAGVFSLAWILRGDISFTVLTCAQAAVVNIRATVTGTTSVIDTFACVDGSGFTQALLAAAGYSVTFEALNLANTVIGTLGPVSGLTITEPNGVTSLGAQTIPILNL